MCGIFLIIINAKIQIITAKYIVNHLKHLYLVNQFISKMKKTYFSSKKFRMVTFLVLGAAFFGNALSSCKNEDEDFNTDVTLQFKVEASPDVEIKAVVTQVGLQQNQLNNVSGTSWQSAPQVVNTKVGAVHLASTADGVDAQSQLIVKILLNGTVVQADTAKGVALMAKTMYDFSKFKLN